MNKTLNPYFIISPGVPEPKNDRYYRDYGRAKSESAKVGGVVTNKYFLGLRGRQVEIEESTNRAGEGTGAIKAVRIDGRVLQEA